MASRDHPAELEQQQQQHRALLETLRALTAASSQSQSGAQQLGSPAHAHAPAAGTATGSPTPRSVTGDAAFLQLQPQQQQGLDWLMASADQALAQARAPQHAGSSGLLAAISSPASATIAQNNQRAHAGINSSNGLQELMAGMSLTSPNGPQSPFTHHLVAGQGQMLPSGMQLVNSDAAVWELLEGASGGMAGGAPPMLVAAAESASLYVSGLPPDANELMLYQTFSPFGALHSCKVKTDPATGLCSGVAFINYVNRTDAQRAMRLMDRATTPGGRQLHITLQAPRKVRAAAAATKAMATMQQRQGPFMMAAPAPVMPGPGAHAPASTWILNHQGAGSTMVPMGHPNLAGFW